MSTSIVSVGANCQGFAAVHDPAGVRRLGAGVRVDGRVLDSPEIPLVDDGARREVEVRPRASGAAPNP